MYLFEFLKSDEKLFCKIISVLERGGRAATTSNTDTIQLSHYLKNLFGFFTWQMWITVTEIYKKDLNSQRINSYV